MKKYVQVFLVLALVLAVIGLARIGPAWAGAFQPASQPILYSPLIPAKGVNAPLVFETTIDENVFGSRIGGVCLFDVVFRDQNRSKELKIEANARVPLEESMKVPFSGEGDLFFPGCRFIHYKNNSVINVMSANEANTKVCFGANPAFDMTIYFYPDSGPRAWSSLTTYLEDSERLVCAEASYTGVYMPAGKLREIEEQELAPGQNPLFPDGFGGTVLPPPALVSFSASGTYAVGGIVVIIVRFEEAGLSNTVFITAPEDTAKVPFPDNDDLLYLPGVQLNHYRYGEILERVNKDDEEQGEWEICFAARPGKQMTIYYYQTEGEDITPTWTALETTTQRGLACAKGADFTGIYAPAGR